MWKVKKILEGDYGCEERMPGEPKNAIVYLIDDEGNETNCLVDDDWLYENNIYEGSMWPEPFTEIINGDGYMQKECNENEIKEAREKLVSMFEETNLQDLR